MAAESPADAPDWLGACRRSVAAIATMLARPPDDRRARDRDRHARRGRRPHARDRRGRRGRRLRRAADALYDAGARFTAVSEERGVVDFGSDALLVVIDPIDGSLNAKRGLPHHALSVAVADGPTMADVFFGFVQDFGPAGGVARVARRAARSSTACRSTPTLVERRNRAASSRSWASSRPIRAGSCSPSTRWRRPRTGSARSARSRSRCARSRPPASTRWRR